MPQTASRAGIAATTYALSGDVSGGWHPAASPARVASTDARASDRLGSNGDGSRGDRQGQPPERGAFAMFGALTGIATLSAVLVVGGAGLGLLVDDWTSAPHVFVFVGLVLGVVAAVLATRVDRPEVLPMSEHGTTLDARAALNAAARKYN